MNPDPTAPFYDQNLSWFICAHCLRNEICKKDESFPVISPLTRYILQYLSEIDAGFCVYPLQGSWEHQPVWFISLLNTARQALTNKQKDEAEKAKERRP